MTSMSAPISAQAPRSAAPDGAPRRRNGFRGRGNTVPRQVGREFAGGTGRRARAFRRHDDDAIGAAQEGYGGGDGARRLGVEVPGDRHLAARQRRRRRGLRRRRHQNGAPGLEQRRVQDHGRGRIGIRRRAPGDDEIGQPPALRDSLVIAADDFDPCGGNRFRGGWHRGNGNRVPRALLVEHAAPAGGPFGGLFLGVLDHFLDHGAGHALAEEGDGVLGVGTNVQRVDVGRELLARRERRLQCRPRRIRAVDRNEYRLDRHRPLPCLTPGSRNSTIMAGSRPKIKN